jgi:myo-inositol-1-phosphate synthase
MKRKAKNTSNKRREIRVAILGVGNCASSLVQGVEYYKEVDEKSPRVPGLMHNVIGGYRISDIKFVAAFDINSKKVGKDLSEAVFAYPNCTEKFAKVPKLGVRV